MVEPTVDVSIDPELRQGRFADWWRVTSTSDGFVLDLGIHQPYAPEQVVVVARILLPRRGPIELIDALGNAWDAFMESRAGSGS